MYSDNFSGKIQQWIESNRLSYKKAAGFLKVTDKTIYNWINGTIPKKQSRRDFILNLIESYPSGISPEEKRPTSLPRKAEPRRMLTPDHPLLDNVSDYLCQIALKLAIKASETALVASYRFQFFDNSEWLFREDKAAMDAVKVLLDDLVQDEKSILSDGLILFDETKYLSENQDSRISFIPGPRNKSPDLTNARLILFIDAIDGSYFFCDKRRNFGCSVISLYHLDVGFLAVVVSDIVRRRVFIKRRGMSGFVQSITESIDPAVANKYSDFHFTLGAVTNILTKSNNTFNDKKLKGSVINIYRSTVRRVKAYQGVVEKLGSGDHDPRHIVSNPGSGGITDLAIGAVDASIETEIGFRLWDASALFIISEVYDVLDENGEKIDMTKPLFESRHYKTINELEYYLNNDFRIKFIVALPNLTAEILKVLGKKQIFSE